MECALTEGGPPAHGIQFRRRGFTRPMSLVPTPFGVRAGTWSSPHRTQPHLIDDEDKEKPGEK